MGTFSTFITKKNNLIFILFWSFLAAQGDHVDAARILLYYKSTLVDDVSSVGFYFERKKKNFHFFCSFF